MRIAKALFCAAMLSLFAAATFAQAPLEPAQLPSRTVFYLIWRGTPPADARSANALLSLWDDPGFAPVRAAMLDSFLKDANSPKPGAKATSAQLTQQDLNDYASLLENPLEFGYITQPKRAASSAAAAAANGSAVAHPWNGFFFIYNRTGKEALLTKALLRIRANQQADPKDAPKLSQVTVAGVSALKFERKSGTSYWIEDGKYAISANDPAVLEEILPGLQGKTAGGASLAQSAAYQEAQPILGNGPIEFFLRVPDLKELTPETTANSGVRVGAILDALKLEAIHSICGRVTFENARTHVQGAVLGDASAGSLFDIIPDGTPAPASAILVSADTVYYNASRINFLAVYNTVKRVAGAFFPKGQEGNVVIFESLAQTRIGRPIPDALALFTGEFASIQNSPALDQKKQVYFVGIQNKPEMLKLLRTALAENVASERSEGDVTYLKISLGGKSSSAGTMQYNFYNIAVTPDSILAANRTEAIRELLAKRPAAPSWPAAVQSARAQFPKNLVAFNYVDMQHLDWAGIKEQWRQDYAKATPKAAVPTAGQKAPAPSATKMPSWFEQLDPQVLGRHLHFTSSASWKDAKGIHFEQWLD
jgi:hypothetical protein